MQQIDIDKSLEAKVKKLKYNTIREIAIEMGLPIAKETDRKTVITMVVRALRTDPDPVGLLNLYLDAE